MLSVANPAGVAELARAPALDPITVALPFFDQLATRWALPQLPFDRELKQLEV